MGKCWGERRKPDSPLSQPTVKARWSFIQLCLKYCRLCPEDYIEVFVFEEEVPRSNLYLTHSIEMTLCGMVVIYMHMILHVNCETSPSWQAAGNELKRVAGDQSGRESFAPGLSLSGETVNSTVPSHTSLMMYSMITHASTVKLLPPCCKWHLNQLHNIQIFCLIL